MTILQNGENPAQNINFSSPPAIENASNALVSALSNTFITNLGDNPLHSANIKSGRPHPKIKFSPEEDFRLRTIILRFGDQDWNFIAGLMKDRNPRQCRERWLKYLAPNVRFDPWTSEEDKQLEGLVNNFGQKWVKISKFFRNRTDINVKNRWLVLQRQKAKGCGNSPPLSPNQKKSAFSIQLDTTPQNSTTHEHVVPILQSHNLNPIPMPLISSPSKREMNEREKIVSILGTNTNIDMEIWDGILPPPVMEYETPVESFSVPWN